MDQIIDELYEEAKYYKETGELTQEQYEEIFELLNEINDYVKKNGITFCELAY